MAQTAASGRIGRLEPVTVPTYRSAPTEGWLTILLHVVILAITANSVVRIDQAGRSNVLIPLAIGGMVIGCLVAKTPALDAVSHVLAFVMGAGVSLLLSAIHIDGLGTTWHRHGKNALELARNLARTQAQTRAEPLTDHELMIVIGLTLWLVGYSSAWMLYRRHWLFASLAVPAALIVISLRFEDREPVTAIAAFAIASLVMAARHHAFLRQVEWARLRIPAPESIMHRFTTSGSVIAVAVLLAGWVLPIQAPSGVVERVSDQAQQWWEQAAGQLNRFAHHGANGGAGDGTFADFDDSFTIGKEFKPSPQVIATLAMDHPTYLAVRRYDTFDGTTWSSAVDDTFRMPNDKPGVSATSLTYDGNVFVVLSPEVDTNRQREQGAVTVLVNTGGRLLSIDTYSSTSIPTIVVMGWIQVPETRVDIDTVDPSTLPLDLNLLVQMMQHAKFTPDANGRPSVLDADQARQIEQRRAEMLQYPVNTALSYGNNGHVILTVSGRVPNYDDIEAVYANPPDKSPGSYVVTGRASYASPEKLRAAGVDYPAWVTGRYLQLSDSTTAETKTLAQQIISDAGADNPFDKAMAVQNYLQTTYDYALNSEQTPKGQDAVDFFLFGKKVGRCEEFATSMVVMLRSLGIPARLVDGYRAGDEQNAVGDWVYRGEQAHTWVEVFFPKYGWIPFEPTKGMPPITYGDDRSQAPAATAVADTPEDPTPTPTAQPEVTREATPQIAPPVASTNDGGSSRWQDRLQSGLGLVMLLLTGVVALLVVIVGAAWAWSLRGLSPGAALYARVMRIGRLWGVEAHPSMTPSEYASEFGQTVPKAERAVQMVTSLYTAERYGGVDISHEARSGGRRAWRSVRTAVFAWRPWRRAKHRRR